MVSTGGSSATENTTNTLLFFISVTVFFSTGCVLHHHSHRVVGTVSTVHLCHAKTKTLHLPFFHLYIYIFFFLLKCTHEFSEHCIKFIKNHLILRLQKWMQKKCYLYFSLREKKTCLRKVVYTCNVFFYFP